MQEVVKVVLEKSAIFVENASENDPRGVQWMAKRQKLACLVDSPLLGKRVTNWSWMNSPAL
jgi:hypothetical protein